MKEKLKEPLGTAVVLPDLDDNFGGLTVKVNERRTERAAWHRSRVAGLKNVDSFAIKVRIVAKASDGQRYPFPLS